jgi:two-component system, NtrC family, sensor kinase
LKTNKPKRSIRTILITSYLLIATVPVAVVSLYIHFKFQEIFNEEIIERLKQNSVEVSRQVEVRTSRLGEIHKIHLRDKALSYFLLSDDEKKIESAVSAWTGLKYLSTVSIFNRSGQQIVELKKTGFRKNPSKQMNAKFLEMIGAANTSMLVDYVKKNGVDLILFSKIKSKNGDLLGYLEESISLDKKFISQVSKKLGVNIYVNDPLNKFILSSHKLSTYFMNSMLKDVFSKSKNYFEISSEKRSYLLNSFNVPWGNQNIQVALGLSPKSDAILKNMAMAIGTALVFVFIIIVFMSLALSRLVLKPLSDLVDAIQGMELGKEVSVIHSKNQTEIGLLAESFNEMANRIYNAQLQLVQSEKMASLGQLVAGVAHELNNPISFIYSNMQHLREYSEVLIKQINLAIHDCKEFSQQVDKEEISYLSKDIPKLIKSCEDGAQRTKEIVLGLRSFSRLDSSDLNLVDLNQCIESTLVLLTSEIKDKMSIKKDFEDQMMAECYPSQINQVIMNVISNAIQAVDGQGEVGIKTFSKDDYFHIRIQDNGVGMTDDQKAHVFEPFYTTKDIGQGTGLGMSISFGIIQKHGGEIKIESEEGKGSIFTIILPKEFNH